MILFSFLVQLTSHTALGTGEDCDVNLDELGGRYPPLLTQNGDFVFPTSETEEGTRLLKFGHGDSLELYCHGSLRYQESTTVVDGAGTDTGSSKFGLICQDGKFVSVKDQSFFSVEDATCSRRQEPRLVRNPETCSAVGADGRKEDLSELVWISIGWQLEESFIEQIGVCHDEKLFATIWTNYTLHGASIDFRDIDPGRPSFRIDTTYNKRFYTWTTSTGMNRFYSKNSQVESITSILGTNTMGTEPIIENTSSGTNYFAKGHLSPDAAFIYNVMQDATYYFFNVAPQFQSFNNGNWKSLEYNTRDLGTKLGRKLAVYTGTSGILKYPDVNDVEQEIYLVVEDKYVPAPLYYWKVIQDKETNTAVAFIGLNDPHASEAPEELCTNVCSAMSWVDWEMTDLPGGYMYCCDLGEAAAALEEINSLGLEESSGLIQLPGAESTTTAAPTPAAACQVNLDQLSGKYPPMMTRDNNFLYPVSEEADGTRFLKFDEEESLELYCHGSLRYQASTTVVEGSGADTGSSSLGLVCRGGRFVATEDERPIAVEDTTCSRKQEPRLVRTQEPCSAVGSDGRTSDLSELVRVSIGWQIGENFVEQIGICHDERNFATIWSNYTLHGENIDYRDKDPARPSFRIDTSYNKRFYTWTTSTGMNTYYSKNNQVSAVTSILGTNQIGSVDIIENSSSGTNYFAKGHLSPDAGFIYNVEQDATYYFVNVAPQFQSFNNGNWKSLEINTRDLARALGRDVTVYSGTSGILTFPDINNNQQQIFLYEDKYVPAPLYYWKVIQDKSTNTAVAFLGMNNPHEKAMPLELCTNVCSAMSWVDWEMTDLPGGYMYCCDHGEAAAALEEINSLGLGESSGLIQLPQVP